MDENQEKRNILHSPEKRPDVLVHVADNVRRLRQDAGLSQQLLAERADVSRRMLVNIEKGDVNVSLNTLDRIAETLGVLFHALVQPRESGDSDRIEEVAWAGRDPASHATLLASKAARNEVELWSWSLAPGERYDSAANPGGWQDMLVVTAGTLTLYVADEPPRTIQANDFHVFASDRAHGYANEGSRIVTFIRNVVY
ncbi:helix-turn-helix domain-containing protein [Salinisphaera aquimarina]|uniref:Helix-turn-helix domain-containing protein n=1 Tax=Salinisphaera aquimarina TaxID=2094031 RepID=A0ABV7ELC7_9GAMM